ncbi:MAG: BMC domain-containing protein [Verrucomicrobiota bacterium]|nr:BMC domain-containing protein [Limisphaera sp.]MDW8382936.1 BMC domain-containing protein [Verrucomicrobiota bacterium]
MSDKSLGLIELSSVAAGLAVADVMLKAEDVGLVLSRSICSGKYMVFVGGDTAAVRAAVEAGVAAADGACIDSFVILQVRPEVVTAMARTNAAAPSGALGFWNPSVWRP